MGQNNFHSPNSHVSMPNNWQQCDQDPNVIVNRLTHQQLQRNHIKIPMKKLTKQAALFFTRMGNIHKHVCRLYYYHYTGYESPGLVDSDKENRNICVYTDRMLKLKPQNWNQQNMISALEGFQQLTTLYGPFKITEQMIKQNQHGQIRVWVNNNPAENRPDSFCNNEKQSIASFLGLLSRKNKYLANSIIGCSSYREALQQLKNWDHERSLSLNEGGLRRSENENKKQKNLIKQDKSSPHRNIQEAITRLKIEQDGWSNSPINNYDPYKHINGNNKETTILKPQSIFSNFRKQRNKVQSYLTVYASPNQKIEYQSPNQIKIQQKSKIDVSKNSTMIDHKHMEKKQKITNQYLLNEYLKNKTFQRDKIETKKYSPVFTEGIDDFHQTFPRAQQSKNHSHQLLAPKITTEQYCSIANKSKKNKQLSENRNGLQTANEFFTFHQITSKLGSPSCSDTSTQKQRNGKIPFFIKEKSKQHQYQQHQFAPSIQPPKLATKNKSSNYPNYPESNRGPTNLNKSSLDMQNLLQKESNSKKQYPPPLAIRDNSADKNHKEVIRNRMSEGPADSYKPRIFSNYNKPVVKKIHQIKTNPLEMSTYKMNYLLPPHAYRGSKCSEYSSSKNKNRTQTNEQWEKFKQNHPNLILEQKTKKPIINGGKCKNDISEQIPTTKSIKIPTRGKQHSETQINQAKKISNLKHQLQQQFVSLFGEFKQTKTQNKNNAPLSIYEQDHLDENDKLTESQKILKNKIKMKKMQFAELKKQAMLVLTAK